MLLFYKKKLFNQNYCRATAKLKEYANSNPGTKSDEVDLRIDYPEDMFQAKEAQNPDILLTDKDTFFRYAILKNVVRNINEELDKGQTAQLAAGQQSSGSSQSPSVLVDSDTESDVELDTEEERDEASIRKEKEIRIYHL